MANPTSLYEYQGDILLQGKVAVHDGDSSHITIVKNTRRYTFTSSHVFMFWHWTNNGAKTVVVQSRELAKKMVMMQNTECNRNLLLWKLWPCNCSSSQSLSSHGGGQGSNPGQSTWNLWWIKLHLDRFFSKKAYFCFSYHYDSTDSPQTLISFITAKWI
jgi:hypothetical protein